MAKLGRPLAGAALILWTLAMAWSMARRDLWAPDEPRYAEVSREMAVTGDWVLPHLNGQLYAHKPPLLFWLTAISARLGRGFTNISVRVPCFLAGVAVVALAGLIGRVLFGSLAGWISALVMLSNYLVLWFLTRVNMDTLFAGGVAGSIFCFYAVVDGRANRRWALPLAYLLLGLATMTKGPAALVMVPVAMLAVVGWRREWRALPRLVSPTGLIVFALTVGVWVAWAAHRGGSAYLSEFLVRRNIDMVVQSHSHRRRVYYYFSNLAVAFAPWTVFLPTAFVHFYRKARGQARGPEAFVLATLVSLFVLMSISSAKRINYLMSLMPFLAALMGQRWAQLCAGGAMNRVERWCGWLLAALLAIGAVAGLVLYGVIENPFIVHVLPGVLLSGLAAVAMAVGMRRGSPRAVFASLTVLMLAIALYANAGLFPHLNVQKSVRPLAMFLREQSVAVPRAKFATYRFSRPGALNFYSGLMFHALRTQEQASAFMRPGRPRFCITDRKTLAELRSYCSDPLTILFEQQKGRHVLVCVANRAGVSAMTSAPQTHSSKSRLETPL